MRLLTLVLFSAGVALTSNAQDKDDPKKELEKLQGAWKLISIASDGQERELGEAGIEGKVVFKDDKYTFTFAGQEEEGTMKFLPDKKPKAVNVDITKGMDKGKKKFG